MPSNAPRTRAVAYLRVSTEKQADHGVSLAAQRAKVEAYAGLYDLELVAIIEDAGASAKTLDRPGLRSALDLLDGGHAEALLVVKLDRLTRSVRDLDALISTWFTGGRFDLLSVSENIDTRSAAGRLILNVLASVSQWEREATGERTAVAMAHKRANGERVGAIPFGSRLAADGVHLEHDPAEREVVGIAIELRAAGLTLRAIASELVARGYRSRAGKTFAPTQIARMLA